MKVIVFTPIWGRHKILDIWLEGVKRLSYEYDIQPVVMASTDEDVNWVVENTDFNAFDPILINVENSPLGRKQNMGLKAISGIDWDYICQISSDVLLAKIPDGGEDLIGFDRALFLDSESGEIVEGIRNQESHLTVGAGRMVSRNIIDKLDYKLWSDDRNRLLDGDSQRRILSAGATSRVISGRYVISVKSDVQITPYGSIKSRGEVVDVDLSDYISKKEIELINGLRHG